jgi:nucleotide-binding universal stress UspA family protein
LTSPIPSDSAATHEQAGYRDLMLTLVSYPDRVPDQALHNAVRLAARLGGQVTAVAPAVRVTAPRNRLADMLLNFKELVRTEEARSAENARSLADAFEAAARPLGVMVERRIEPVELFFEADRLAEDARTFDLAMVPYGKTTANDRSVAEAMLFHSGRPVLLVPDADPLRDEGRLETVAVAWDGGREAARALADATPLLTAAGQVRILVITGEKASVKAGTAAQVIRHLARHGVAAEVDEVDAGGEPIGQVLSAYLAERKIGLLVMGAYGRSKAREMLLGGATQSVLQDAGIPVLMSH